MPESAPGGSGQSCEELPNCLPPLGCHSEFGAKAPPVLCVGWFRVRLEATTFEKRLSLQIPDANENPAPGAGCPIQGLQPGRVALPFFELGAPRSVCLMHFRVIHCKMGDPRGNGDLEAASSQAFQSLGLCTGDPRKPLCLRRVEKLGKEWVPEVVGLHAPQRYGRRCDACRGRFLPAANSVSALLRGEPGSSTAWADAGRPRRGVEGA